MKSIVKHCLASLMLVALVGTVATVAFAKEHDKVKTQSVTFSVDTTVNGTLLKAGDYEIRFDEQTNNLSVLRHGKVVAEATGHLQDRTGKAESTELATRDNVLISVTFRGQ